ncbi:hypothetical protein CXB51_016320 [Gossypium anomalum]|uniref:Rapid ALkalinization Factor n=1 Tax=Gossypium anomalum TaxID=47600 RepID=A0A8J5YSW6_9ROSI|nr:hypothetical protein CXB51_016320 [Gossypium anomalum]
MGNNVKGRGPRSCKATLTIMMMAMVLLLGQQVSAFSATTSNNNNSNNLATHCGASTMEECLVDIGHADHVFFAEPETSLQKVTPKFIDVSKNNLMTPNDKCGRPRSGQPYNPCVPDPSDSKKGEHCTAIYKDNNRNRGCK